MSFNVYQDSIKKTNVASLNVDLTDLSPGTLYVFSVTETDGDDESTKSESVSVLTNGRITLPTLKEISSINYSIDPIGVEFEGFDTGEYFGGSEPVTVPILNSTVNETNRVLEINGKYHMGDAIAELIDVDKYVIIDGNRSMEVTVK